MMGDRPGSDRLTLIAIGGLAGLGVVLALVTVLDGYESVVSRGRSVRFILLESLLPLVSNLLLIGYAGWLLRTEVPRAYLEEIAQWTGGILGVLVLVVGWGYVFQQVSYARPVFVVADLLSICTLAGIVIGTYSARREQQHELLRDQRSRLSAAFNNVPDATIGVDTADNRPTIVMANPAFEQLFDLDAADVVGEPLERFTAERGWSDGSLPGSTTQWGDREIVLETEQERRTFLRLDAPGTDTTDSTYDVYMDITPRRQQQERLSVLSRTLRHDIRNKMTVIKGNATTLRDNPDHPVREQMVSSIDSAAEYILTMSERVYDIEQSLSGPTQTDERELVSILENAIDEVRGEYPSCEFRVDAPASLRVNAIDAVPKALRELLDNAAKHNDSDDPTVTVTVAPSDSESVTLRIEDDGPGIPADVRQVITGEEDRTQLNHLDGLGLWFANWVVRDSGGRFELRERDPHGTSVEITLPRAE